MKPPQHRINWAVSRNYNVNDMYTKKFKCERPWCNCVASSIHHILCSYRGKRNDNPENLIALCLKHHEWVHNHNTFDNREKLLSITKQYDNSSTMTSIE